MQHNQTTSTMLKFESPKDQSSIIKVIGVGGGGGNAVNYMYNQGIKGVDFIICNTDAQALEKSPVPNKIQLGTKGLGAGNIPLVAREAAMENADQIKEMLSCNTKMLFITAGMGGGTGTGAAPVIAEIAKELGILTVGIITLPFNFEGRKRSQQAEHGIKEMLQYVDSIIVIYNEKLRELYGNLAISDAFKKADDVLLTAAKGIAEIITVEGYVNVDFEDINTVMKNSGSAIMGSGEAEGENRALKAVEQALKSPLLNDATIKGSKKILLNLTSGLEELTMDEVSEITEHITFESGSNADVIWGNSYDEKLGNKISVIVIATGFETNQQNNLPLERLPEKKINTLVEPIVESIKSEPLNEDFELPAIEVVSLNEPEPEMYTPPKLEVKEEDITNFTVYNKNEKFTPEPKGIFPEVSRESTVISPNNSLEVASEGVNTFASTNNAEYEIEDSEVNRNAKERKDKLRQFSAGLKTAEGLEKIEKIPAYQRNGIELTDVKLSSESEISKYQLNTDDKNNFSIQSNNTFLHDNPD